MDLAHELRRNAGEKLTSERERLQKESLTNEDIVKKLSDMTDEILEQHRLIYVLIVKFFGGNDWGMEWGGLSGAVMDIEIEQREMLHRRSSYSPSLFKKWKG